MQSSRVNGSHDFLFRERRRRTKLIASNKVSDSESFLFHSRVSQSKKIQATSDRQEEGNEDEISKN